MTDQQVIDAVEAYCIDRFEHLDKASLEHEFDPEDYERIKTDENGYAETYISNLEIKETEQEDDLILYYVSATLYFEASGEDIEGTTDIYQAYMGADGRWAIDWHAS